MQGLRGIAGEQGDAALTENRSGIDAGIDQMHGATGLRHPGLHGLPPCLQTSEGRKQRGVNVQDAAREGVEQGLLDGSADTGSWLAEQRNIVDTAVGDVYSNELVDVASCIGERCVVPFEQLPDTWKRLHSEDKADYTAPVLWRCTDPCVLGVDYAPQSDFCAFVVIRLGPLSPGRE